MCIFRDAVHGERKNGNVQTIVYRAPEILWAAPGRTPAYSCSADVWSVGAMVLRMMSGPIIWWELWRRGGRYAGDGGHASVVALTSVLFDVLGAPGPANQLGLHPTGWDTHMRGLSPQSLPIDQAVVDEALAAPAQPSALRRVPGPDLQLEELIQATMLYDPERRPPQKGHWPRCCTEVLDASLKENIAFY
jgi:serine/threonine protein kinase